MILVNASYFVMECDCYIFIVIKIQPFSSIFPSVDSMDRVFVVYHFGVSRKKHQSFAVIQPIRNAKKNSPIRVCGCFSSL